MNLFIKATNIKPTNIASVHKEDYRVVWRIDSKQIAGVGVLASVQILYFTSELDLVLTPLRIPASCSPSRQW